MERVFIYCYGNYNPQTSGLYIIDATNSEDLMDVLDSVHRIQILSSFQTVEEAEDFIRKTEYQG